MKTVPRIVPLLVFLAPTLTAQVAPDLAERIRNEGLGNSKVMEHLDYLTNHIGHRLTGSENLVKAAYWVASEFERMGLEVQVEKWGEWKVYFGVEAGDVLKAVNGKPITALVDIFRIGREDGLDKGVELTLDRGGQELKVKMAMENAPTGRRGRRRGGD